MPFRTLERLERPLDQLGSRLGQDGNRDVVGYEILLDQRTDELEVGLRGRGESDLDLLEAEFDQQREETPLARGVHRADECLIAVAQVGGAPDRRTCEDDVGPRSVGQLDDVIGTVFPVRHGHEQDSFAAGRTTPLAGDGYVHASPLPGKAEQERAETDRVQEGRLGQRCDEWDPSPSAPAGSSANRSTRP